MKLSTEEKTTIYSFLSSIKEKMEYINAYYVRNFKQSIDCYVIETKKNSLLEVANEDYQNFSIWKLTEMIEKHILHHNFIKTTEEYYENFNDLKQWFEKHPLTKSALQKNIDILYDAFTFSYVTDGIGMRCGLILMNYCGNNIFSSVSFCKEFITVFEKILFFPRTKRIEKLVVATQHKRVHNYSVPSRF